MRVYNSGQGLTIFLFHDGPLLLQVFIVLLFTLNKLKPIIVSKKLGDKTPLN